MNLYYTLDENKNPVPVDMWEYAMKHQQVTHVAKDVLEIDGVSVRVSTVFLGLNHAWGEDMPPILFETMIFGGEHDQYQERYNTWDEAVEGHKRAMELVLS